VTCVRYEAPPLVVQSLINVTDDVARGRSHFLVEAQAARELLVSADGGTDRMYVIDELFRGTNTIDRIAAGTALLRALDRSGARVVAATHDAELGPQLSRFRRHYFTERIEDGTLSFDYRLREGDIAPRNALAVLELAGFPEDVLEDARRLAAT
jgi:DNA mismatch repair ATPase MutS